MNGPRLLSLAAGTVLDCTPHQAVWVAAEAGFDAAGLWFDPATWTDDTTRQVQRALDRTGLAALDIEPVILGRGSDPGERVIEVAAELGVADVLVASGPAPRSEVVARLAALAAHAAAVAPHVTLALEFLPIFTIRTLEDALGVVVEIDAPNVGVLIDSLHLDRSGGHPDDVDAGARARLPYLQLADAPATHPATAEAWRDEAVHGRLLPGDGVLPLAELLAAVPTVPVSVELRSRALMERYVDPVERAVVVLAATQRIMTHS